MVCHGDIASVGDYQRYRTVDAPVHSEKEVVDGDDIRPGGVVGDDRYLIVLSEAHFLLYLAGKCRISSSMLPYQHSVDIDPGAAAHSLETQEEAAVLPLLGEIADLAVGSLSLVEILDPQLHVIGIPGMGKGYIFPCIRLRYAELPAVIEGQYLSGTFRTVCRESSSGQ